MVAEQFDGETLHPPFLRSSFCGFAALCHIDSLPPFLPFHRGRFSSPFPSFDESDAEKEIPPPSPKNFLKKDWRWNFRVKD